MIHHQATGVLSTPETIASALLTPTKSAAQYDDNAIEIGRLITAIPQYAAGTKKNMAPYPAVISIGKNTKVIKEKIAEPSKKCCLINGSAISK